MVLGERPDGLRAVVVDAKRARIVREVRVPGHLEAQYAEPTPAGMALLLSPLAPRPMGPVLVGVIRPSGAVKVVEVSRILAGYVDLLLGLHMDSSLTAFGLDGRRRFSVAEQVFDVGAVASNGRYVYAYNLAPGSKGSAVVVDARSGGKLSWPQTPPFGPVLSSGLVVPGT